MSDAPKLPGDPSLPPGVTHNDIDPPPHRVEITEQDAKGVYAGSRRAKAVQRLSNLGALHGAGPMMREFRNQAKRECCRACSTPETCKARRACAYKHDVTFT